MKDADTLGRDDWLGGAVVELSTFDWAVDRIAAAGPRWQKRAVELADTAGKVSAKLLKKAGRIAELGELSFELCFEPAPVALSLAAEGLAQQTGPPLHTAGPPPCAAWPRCYRHGAFGDR